MRLIGAILFSACLALTGCGGDDTEEALAEAKKGFVDSCSEGPAADRCTCIWDEMLKAEGEEKMMALFYEAGAEGAVSEELSTITAEANAACV